MTETRTAVELAKFVMYYAYSRYGKFSWDVVAECLSEEELATELAATRVRTERGAINYVWERHVRPFHIQRKEIEATVF